MNNPFDLLEQDHRNVESLLDALAESDEGEEREMLLSELAMSLQVHMAFEEEAIYPFVASEIDPESAEEANVEHGLAREGLAKMQELVAAPGFGAAVEMVKAGIGHHVEEEESEIFPQLRKDIEAEQQAALADQLMAAKEVAGLPVDLAAGRTKAELMEEAKRAGVPRRSSMTKDELAAAITDV